MTHSLVGSDNHMNTIITSLPRIKDVPSLTEGYFPRYFCEKLTEALDGGARSFMLSFGQAMEEDTVLQVYCRSQVEVAIHRLKTNRAQGGSFVPAYFHLLFQFLKKSTEFYGFRSGNYVMGAKMHTLFSALAPQVVVLYEHDSDIRMLEQALFNQIEQEHAASSSTQR